MPGKLSKGNPSLRGDSGFSLVELVAIIVLIAILAVVAYPRMGSQANFSGATFRQELLSAALYAQNLAIASGCEVQFSVDVTADSYQLLERSGGNNTRCGSGAFATAVFNPAQGSASYNGNAPTGVDITAGTSLYFDSLGASNNTAAEGITLVPGGTITIEPGTGYAH